MEQTTTEQVGTQMSERKPNLRTIERALFALVGMVLIGVGLLAIASRSHTGSTRRAGWVHFQGEDAVFIGQTLVILGLLPMVALLPSRWVGWALAAWLVGLWSWLGLFLFR